jgi:phosphoglycerol transferase MdoB-like AlkP superfamily enzyme
MNFQSQANTPFYMHMHVLFPHQPLVFDSEGNKVNDPIAANRFDEELKDAYLQQLLFANKKTLEIIDSIQQKNSNDVIIILSDHGGRFGVNWLDPSEIDYFRGLNNLAALYFPGQESDIPTEISAVNIFRIFFNSYFDAQYDILDEKLIWYNPEKPFLQFDVTEIVKSSSLRN